MAFRKFWFSNILIRASRNQNFRITILEYRIYIHTMLFSQICPWRIFLCLCPCPCLSLCLYINLCLSLPSFPTPFSLSVSVSVSLSISVSLSLSLFLSLCMCAFGGWVFLPLCVSKIVFLGVFLLEWNQVCNVLCHCTWSGKRCTRLLKLRETIISSWNTHFWVIADSFHWNIDNNLGKLSWNSCIT